MDRHSELERLRRARAEIDSELRRYESDSQPTLAPDDLAATRDTAARPGSFTWSPPPIVLSTRYDIIGELGAGGMGIVYRARDRETGALLAIKVLRPEIAADPAMSERFKSELRLARQITHKHVCRIYDFNRIGDVACISMELVEGDSLRRVLARLGNLSVRAAVRIGIEICDALREAHRQHIVHRDMKPENVMLDASGAVKVMDFGIAQSVRRQVSEAAIAGTPGYMSPEQAQGKPADERSDIYAVGMILFEMLTSELPFKGDSAGELARAAIEAPPRAPRELEPTVPQHLENIVLRCLEKEPARRFQSIAELELALRAETPSDVSQFNIPVPETLTRPGRADTVLLVASALALLFFFAEWPRIVPATETTLQMDEVSARREAQRWVDHFVPSPHRREFPAAAEYNAEQYREDTEDIKPDLAKDGLVGMARAAGLPLFWRVNFGDTGTARFLGEWEGYVLLSREGKPVEYHRTAEKANEFLPTYKPPVVELRRSIAENAVKDFCGQTLEGIPYSETAGGQWGASYSIVWQRLHPPGALPVAQVAMWQERPYQVRCASAAMPVHHMPLFREMFGSTIGSIMSLLAMIAVAVWFVRGNYYSSPLFVRRAPMALLVGIAYGWIAATSGSLGTRFGSASITFGVGLGIGLLCLIQLVTAEHRMLRFEPSKLAAWCHFSAGRVFEPGVPVAVVRGIACGALLAALQTAIGMLLQTLMMTHRPGKVPLSSLLLGIPDPASAAFAVTSGFPALFTLAVVGQNAFSMGFLALAIWYLITFKFKQRYFAPGPPVWWKRWHGRIAFVIDLTVLLTVASSSFHFFFGESVGPLLAFFVVPLLLVAGVVVILLRYDLLTSFFAVAALMLLTVNTTVCYLLSDIGNANSLVLFGTAAALGIAAALLAFRPAIAAKLQGSRLQIG